LLSLSPGTDKAVRPAQTTGAGRSQTSQTAWTSAAGTGWCGTTHQWRHPAHVWRHASRTRPPRGRDDPWWREVGPRWSHDQENGRDISALEKRTRRLIPADQRHTW